MRHSENAGRDHYIVQRRQRGDHTSTYTSIAKDLSLSVTRVREIYHRAMGLPLVSAAAQARAEQRREQDARGRDIVRERERASREAAHKARLHQRRLLIAQHVHALEPRWQQLSDFGVWLSGTWDDDPLRRYCHVVLKAWYDGQANETATVQRLWRLVDKGEAPEVLRRTG